MSTTKEMTIEELKAELARREEAEKRTKESAKKTFKADKDSFCAHSASKFKQLQSELRSLKEYTITEANKLFDRMYAMEDKAPKEVKSFTMKNEDDTVKITVDRQERIEFDENAQVHIETIKEIFKEKFAPRNKGMYNLLDTLLIKGNKGDYDPRLLAKARRAINDLGDQKLITEFAKLEDCQRVVGTALYCRCYIRDKKKKWQDVSLQFSSL